MRLSGALEKLPNRPMYQSQGEVCVMQKVFEVYTRKPEFLSRGTTFEAIYVPPGGHPDSFDPREWDFLGRAFPPKSATLAELRSKTPIYRHCPAGIDPRVLWPNL